MRNNPQRLAIGILSLSGLVMLFLFQKINFAFLLIGLKDTSVAFFINKSLRFFLNDVLAIGLIYALFNERKYIMFALWVQIAGLLFLLIPYFVLKMYHPKYNGPLINFLHRIILNPTLLLLLIPAFYAQHRQQHKK